MLKIIIIIFVVLMIIGLIKEYFAEIIGIGILVGGIYLIVKHFDSILGLFTNSTIWKWLIIIIIIGCISNSISKRNQEKLRVDIVNTINKMGMAEAQQISKALLKNISKVEEELKVLVSLGEIDAIQLNEGDKKGSLLYKSKFIDVSSSNCEVEEITLD